MIDLICTGYFKEGQDWEGSEVEFFKWKVEEKGATWKASPHCECSLIAYLTNMSESNKKGKKPIGRAVEGKSGGGHNQGGKSGVYSEAPGGGAELPEAEVPVARVLHLAM